MTSSRNSLLAVLVVAALGASGCSTVSQLQPVPQGKEAKDESPAKAERISIISARREAGARRGAEGRRLLPAAVRRQSPTGRCRAAPPSNRSRTSMPAPNLPIAWRKGSARARSGADHVTAPPVAAARQGVRHGRRGRVVSAHDAQSGAEVWRTNIRPGDNKRDREAFGGGMAFADGKLYVDVRLPRGRPARRRHRRRRLAYAGREQPIHGAPNVAGGRVYRRGARQHAADLRRGHRRARLDLSGPVGVRRASWRPPARRCPATRWWRPSAPANWWRCARPTATTCGTRRCRAPAAPARSPRSATSRAAR